MSEQDATGKEATPEQAEAGTEAQPTPPPPPPPAPPPPVGYDYGAASTVGARPGWKQDPTSSLVLPEGVQLASIGRRIGAYFLSLLLFLVTLGIGWIIWGLIVWGRGQTPALQVLKMRCWRPDDQKVAGWGWMALRNVIGYLADSILGLITEIVSFVLFLSTPRRQALHDFIGGTVVLHDPDGLLAIGAGVVGESSSLPEIS